MLAVRNTLIVLVCVISMVAGCGSKEPRGPFTRITVRADTTDPCWPTKPADQSVKMEGIRRLVYNRLSKRAHVPGLVVRVEGNNRLIIAWPSTRELEESPDGCAHVLKFYHLDNIGSFRNAFPLWTVRQSVNGDGSYKFTGFGNRVIDSVKQPDEVMKEIVGDKKPVFSDKYVLPNAQARLNGQDVPVVAIQFYDKGIKSVEDFTRSHIDECLAVFFDGQLLALSRIEDTVSDGCVEISGFANPAKAKEVATLINNNTRVVALKLIKKEVVWGQ